MSTWGRYTCAACLGASGHRAAMKVNHVEEVSGNRVIVQTYYCVKHAPEGAVPVDTDTPLYLQPVDSHCAVEVK